jgi:hypothetical protein
MSLSSYIRLPLLLPAIAFVFAAGCSTAAPPATSTAPATASPAAAVATPAATAATPMPTHTPYHVDVPAELVGTTWHADIQNGQVTSGLWTLEFTSNEILATNPKNASDSFAVGVTNITNDQIDFFTERECQAGDPQPDATYLYSVADNQLVFTLIQDKCRDRRSLLTAMPWDEQV